MISKLNIRNDDRKMLKAQIRRISMFRIKPARSVELQEFDHFVAKSECDHRSSR